MITIIKKAPTVDAARGILEKALENCGKPPEFAVAIGSACSDGNPADNARL
jgi:hypothetical protein